MTFTSANLADDSLTFMLHQTKAFTDVKKVIHLIINLIFTSASLTDDRLIVLLGQIIKIWLMFNA
jgi:hypothetical protein